MKRCANIDSRFVFYNLNVELLYVILLFLARPLFCGISWNNTDRSVPTCTKPPVSES